MSTSRTLFLILAGGPGAAGAPCLVARAAAAASRGGRVRVLLTGNGLEWAPRSELGELAEMERVEVALCSRSARERGTVPEALPVWIRWSSLLQWLLDRRPDDVLWTCLP